MRKSGRYRGSRKSIGFLIPFLVVLCIIATVALYVINNNLTFTKEGSFFIPEKKEVVNDVEANIIIDEPDVKEETVGTSVPETLVESTDTAETKAYFIPVGSVKSTELFDSELAAAKSALANMLILEVKAEDGTLAFSTATKVGNSTGLAGDSAVLSANMEKAREAGYRVALYMSCFKDNEAARKNQSYSVSTANGVIWLDGNNTRWLSPYSQGASSYLEEIIREVAAFSPDEIILSNVSFPGIGRTELVKYNDGGVGKGERLEEFIASAKAAAGDIKLSAVYENYKEAALSRSGQSKEIFANAFDTVYVEELGGKYTATFAEVSEVFKKAIPMQKTPSGNEYVIKK